MQQASSASEPHTGVKWPRNKTYWTCTAQHPITWMKLETGMSLLPPFRNLSLQPTLQPALGVLEPRPEAPFHSPPQAPAGGAPTRSNGVSLSDIISRPDASRKLPVPKIGVHELLTSNEGFNSGRSSTTGSLAGGDLMDRM
ncbi:hypothetical protein BN1723_009486 [Verticillium longisporum]|uniref:Uncharacterized protein n=1 Tax=Verticillium longisporum TaxID=100787 RepID=A0A0G4KPP8_VERLO|nr:hypothetical protein BN1723_009486 [Verticillium longisporum]